MPNFHFTEKDEIIMGYIFGTLAFIVAGILCYVAYTGISKAEPCLIAIGIIFALLFGIIGILHIITEFQNNKENNA